MMKTFFTLTLLPCLGLIAATFHAEGQESKQLSQRDQLRAAAQQICPVSGQPLGEHGTPVKVTVGKQKEEVFLCCEACLKGQLNRKHWGTIHANYAKAQGICPVMEQKLPDNPKWTITDGKIIYVCCPPCTKKIAAEKEKYLGKLDQLYAKSLKQK
ncbi:MAG: hypothetical protein HUJ26_01325 [Planctomycetaceae bacterium]|nr:hypothetical protein [Planctomycetaceae bacterium]